MSDGLGNGIIARSGYVNLVKLKYLFLIIKFILVVCVYLTYDENIFSGLSLVDERGGTNYMQARTVLILGITVFGFSCIIEMFFMLLGFTYNFHKNNIIILVLNFFAVYLLAYFICDGWHYVTIWYIFIVAQLPQTLMETYSFIYAVVYEVAKYNRIKNTNLKPVKSN